jgi:3-methyladenine DNA glycosylase/8-oxoguanine DNA glycosylase
MPSLTLVLDRPLDLVLTLGPHLRGRYDPAMRLTRDHAIRATRTPDGPATVELRLLGDRLAIEAWGPGAERALAAAPALVGFEDETTDFQPTHPLIAHLDRRLPGLRIGRTGAVFAALIPAILEQKVTGTEARRGYRGLIAGWGEPAPGPFGLRLLPTPETIAAIPYHELHPFDVERRRADLVRTVAARANRFEEIVDLSLADAYRRLTALPGIGPWTAAEVAFRALGDADAVSVGDYHLPGLVSFAFTGERRGSDERMLELLEPFRPHRARVIRLLEAGGVGPAPRGPRMAPRSFAAF